MLRLVLFILALGVAWGIYKAIRDARRRTDQFERDFWSGGDLNSLYQSAVNDRHHSGALERIFEAGYREFTKLRNQKSLDPATVVDGVRRAALGLRPAGPAPAIAATP